MAYGNLIDGEKELTYIPRLPISELNEKDHLLPFRRSLLYKEAIHEL